MNILAVLVLIGAFWAGVAVLDRLFDLSRFNLDFQGIGIMWRTVRLNNFIDLLSRKATSFWNIYAWAGVFFSSAGMLYVLYFIANKAYSIIVSPKTSSPGVQVFVPGVTVPFWYPMLGLIVLLFAHELSHGIVSISEKIKLKSVGLMFLVAIPGAFVEPDEEEQKKAGRSSRLKLYAAGSFANFLVGGLATLLLVALVSPALQGVQIEDGVLVDSLIKDMPAEKVLQKGMIIHGVGGTQAKTVAEFQDLMARFKPGDVIILNTNKGDFEIKLAENPQKPGRGFIGINIVQNYVKKEGSRGGALEVLANILFWIGFVNINIGLMNLLPITFILDGGKMVKEYLEMILPERMAGVVTTAIGVFCVLLLIINILPGFL